MFPETLFCELLRKQTFAKVVAFFSRSNMVLEERKMLLYPVSPKDEFNAAVRVQDLND